MPIRVFAIRTPPNSASFSGPTIRITTSSEPTRKLNRVKTFALTISATVRVGASGTSLRSPLATRSATSAEVRPICASVEATPSRYGRDGGGGSDRVRGEDEYDSYSCSWIHGWRDARPESRFYSCSPRAVTTRDPRSRPGRAPSSRYGSSSRSASGATSSSDLAGDCGKVTTIITGTSVDPHDYEAVPADLAAFTDAQLVVVNGLDYDAWAERAAEGQSSKPVIVNAGEVVGKSPGDNPHIWYGPDFVTAVVDAVTAQLKTISPDAASYFADQATAWRRSMQPYYDEVSSLQTSIASAKSYAATETVFDYMAQAVGLVDKTPRGFEQSAANETDPSPADIHDFEAALADGSVDVLVFNTQTEGAVPAQLRSVAEAADVPVVDVTESPPAGTTFESWQVTQLKALTVAVAP